MKWGHSVHWLAKSSPSYFNKKGGEKTKDGCVRVGEDLSRRFLPAGGGDLGSRNIKFPAELGSFRKSEDKGDWTGTPVNKRWKRDVRM